MSTRVRTVPKTHREARRGAVIRSNRELLDTRLSKDRHALFWGMRGCLVTPNEVRAKALECEQKARATRDAGVIRMYTELANQWRDPADQIDGNKR